jgi:hypothetical protein
MTGKRPSQLKLRIDEKSVLLQLEMPIALPKKLLIIIVVALFIYFKPELWHAVQAALSFLQ